MVRFRNKLLILVVLLTVGLSTVAGVANAFSLVDRDGTDPLNPPLTGEPDQPGAKHTNAISTSEPGSAPVLISRALQIEWANRIWAAIHLGEIR